MAVFKVETKNKVDIDKKPRVYFTCHHDDFEKYFKKVCEDIFKTHDCAIYYTEDMTEVIAEDEKQVDLGRNNLFVVPVTFKLLSTSNRTMDEDIPYALTEHIPVLPIMMEPGIDEFYSKPDKFGELQYLNPYSTDLTEISYEEKLKKYLESVLISDELAKRVRAAFDAYIFLSYRKKDRKYANELMRLIHSIPECRDIAIWFDEFLTPGESFKENIEKILDDCKLFTLLVTPQIIEKIVDENGEVRDNYVISTEIPLAQKKKEEKEKLGKCEGDIVPVIADVINEAVEKVLKEKNITEFIDARFVDLFKKLFLDAIIRSGIRKSEDSPEHNFLIGLAYLEGIDVEVDKVKAFNLIYSSAQQECIDAIDKLIDMYSTGTGTQVDYAVALEWQLKLIDYYETNENRSSLNDVLVTQYERVSTLSDLTENADISRKYNLKLLDIYETLIFKDRKKHMQKYLETIKRIINVYIYHNQVFLAKNLSNRIMSSDFSHFSDTSDIYLWVKYNLVKSLLYKVLGNPELSLSCLMKAQKSFENQLICEDSKKLSAETYCELGLYYLHLDCTCTDVLVNYKKAVDIYVQLEKIDVYSLKELSNCYMQIAVYYEDINKPNLAKEYRLKLIDLLETQSHIPLSCFSYELIRNYCDLGFLCKTYGDIVSAKQYYLIAIEKCNQMSKINPNKYNSLLAICYFNYSFCVNSFLSYSYFKKAYNLAKPYFFIPECQQIVDFVENSIN